MGAGVQNTLVFLENNPEVKNLITVIKNTNEGIEKEFSIIDWIKQCHRNGELNDIDAYVESIISNFKYDCEDFFNPS